MTWPTNLAQQQIRESINPYSQMNASDRNTNNFIRDITLKQTLDKHERNSSSYSSEDESKEEHSQLYEDMKKHLFSMSSRQRDSRASTGSSFSSRNIKQNNTSHSQASVNRTFSSNKKNEKKEVEASTSSIPNLRGRINTVCSDTTKSKNYCSIQ
ncbi:MAG: hypothetical protein ACRDDW_07885 [Candidatus Rhabdochlamydia sp.]